MLIGICLFDLNVITNNGAARMLIAICLFDLNAITNNGAARMLITIDSAVVCV